VWWYVVRGLVLPQMTCIVFAGAIVAMKIAVDILQTAAGDLTNDGCAHSGLVDAVAERMSYFVMSPPLAKPETHVCA